MGAQPVSANTTRSYAGDAPAPFPGRQCWIVVVVIIAALLLGSAAAVEPALRLNMGTSQSDRYLSGFGPPEAGADHIFRWSERGAYIETFGLLRQPAVLEFQAASMRPPGVRSALTAFSTREWKTSTFEIPAIWRRYTLLLPPTSGRQQLRVDIEPFRAEGNDRRRLGATFTTLALRPISPAIPWTALAILDWPRLAALLTLPFVVALLAARVVRGRLPGTVGTRSITAAGLAAVAPFVVAMRDPIAAVQSLPDAIVPPILAVQTILAGSLVFGGASRFVQLQAHPLSRVLTQDRVLIVFLLLVAIGQAALYIRLIPPWWHYDEAAHFEYAWILATYGTIPPYEQIAASIRIPGGNAAALGHPQLYYRLLSIPLRMAQDADLITQLYLARTLSALCMPATILAAFAVVRELTPIGHRLRWAMPLGLALLPPFADVLTGVTNDAPVTFCGVLVAWSAVRLIRRGVTFAWLALLFVAAGAAALFKNTGIVLVALAPAITLIALWKRQAWRWRWLFGGSAGLILLLLPLLFSVNEPAFWMRWNPNDSGAAIRATRPDGGHALRITTTPPYDLSTTYLANRILPPQLALLRGQTVTIGAWVWASHPTMIQLPGLQAHLMNSPMPQVLAQSAEVGTEPQFLSWTTTVPKQTEHLFVIVQAPPETIPPDLELYIDDIVLVPGVYPTGMPPTFDNPERSVGMWGGQPFVNLLRNPSIERQGLLPNPQIGQMLPIGIVRRAPLRTVATMLDIDYSAPLLFRLILPELVYSFFARFAWFHAILLSPWWPAVFSSIALLALVGCLRVLIRPPGTLPGLRPALLALALIGAGVWGAMLVQQFDPVIPAFIVPFPRYGYPAIVPSVLALIGGFTAIWPARLRSAAIVAGLTGLLVLNLYTIGVITARLP